MPLAGDIIALEQVPDPAFASAAMGAGFAIVPSGNQVISPVNGTIAAVFPSRHAIGIEADNGLEILIHVGIDTVKLNGEGFTQHVQEGQAVQAGELLLTVDFAAIKDKVPSIITPVVFTAMDKGEKMRIENQRPILSE